jgi:hypothetical protein
MQSDCIWSHHDGDACSLRACVASQKNSWSNGPETASEPEALRCARCRYQRMPLAQITQTFTIGTGFMVVWQIVAVLLTALLYVFFEFGNFVQATPIMT